MISSLQSSIQDLLKSRRSIHKEDQFYHTIKQSIYSINLKQFTVEDSTYYSCIVKVLTPPLINNRFGISYQKRSEVEDYFDSKQSLAKFIPENVNQELDKINNSYNSIIFGETGTTKSSIAYKSFLNCINHNKNLITINSKLMNGKMWKFLVNPSNGPLVDSGNTILFQNMDQLSLYVAEQLITIVKNTRFLNRNNLIFTYNTNITNDMEIYNQLMNE